MKIKKCNKCGIEKLITEFYFRKENGKYRDQCKECIIKQRKKYRDENYDEVKEQNRKSHHKHISERKEIMRDNYQRNKEKRKLQAKEYRENNKDHYREYFRNYNKTDERKNYINNWRKREYHNNSAFKLNDNMAGYINRSLKGNKNGRSWEKLVGYTCQDLMQHLEAQFKDGMTWENHGQWHIDHIVPKSLFNIISAEDKGFKKCWALENLRPLWAKDNIRKQDAILCLCSMTYEIKQ